jgi:Zn-dependent protease/CBS domain-containing protein
MISKHNISLGRIFGIPIGLDYSWFLIFALMTWTLAVSYFPAEFSNWPTAQYWVVGAVTAVMLFVSVLLHELGHSVIAIRYKVPVRNITLFVFGGVSQITKEPPSAGAEFLIAIAGPIVSFALAGLFTLAQQAFGSIAPLFAVVKYLAYINGVLGLFNLIPGFPLDGGRVFRAIVWGATHNLRRSTIIAANVGRFIAFGFILVGVWQLLIGNFGGGIWIAFIGWFLESAASSQIHQQMVEKLLDGHKVSEAMVRNYTTIPADETLQSLVDKHILGNGHRSFVVERNDHPMGLLTIHQIKQVPKDEWAMTRADSAMLPLEKTRFVRPSTELEEAIKEMDSDGVNQLPVMDDGHIIGTLNREAVISFLRTLSELGY